VGIDLPLVDLAITVGDNGEQIEIASRIAIPTGNRSKDINAKKLAH
jgi:hypothetical protein